MTENNISVTGNSCPRGHEYGIKEVTNPERIVTSVIKYKSGTITIKTSNTVSEPYTIKRASGVDGVMFTVETTGNLTLDNIIIDGGAVWGEGNTAATASGNSGIKGGALVKVVNNGTLTVKAGATLQNNENISSVERLFLVIFPWQHDVLILILSGFPCCVKPAGCSLRL